MASVTTNYGFDVPTSSDLVKNGATQIALLGQDLDTFLFRPFTKNVLINGGFDIWQRSTSTSGNGYTCTDRFYVYGSGTSTFSRESSVVPTGFQYSFKHLAGATTSSSLAQVIETSNAAGYAGQTVTLSMYASATTATTMSLQLAYSTGTDTGIGGSWTDITATGAATFAAGTAGAFTRGSAIFAVPSTAKSLRVTLAVSGNIANTVAVYYAGAQLEIGSQVSPFTRAGGTIQGELAACQRYYYKTYRQTNAVPTVTAEGNQDYAIGSDGGGNALQTFRFPVVMRGNPTITAYRQDGTSGSWNYNRSGASGTGSITVDTFSDSAIRFYLPVGANYTVVQVYGHLVASAEL